MISIDSFTIGVISSWIVLLGEKFIGFILEPKWIILFEITFFSWLFACIFGDRWLVVMKVSCCHVRIYFFSEFHFQVGLFSNRDFFILSLPSFFSQLIKLLNVFLAKHCISCWRSFLDCVFWDLLNDFAFHTFLFFLFHHVHFLLFFLFDHFQCYSFLFSPFFLLTQAAVNVK